MNSRLTASVVGCGAGGSHSLGALADSESYDLVAAADLRSEVREALEKQYPGIRTFSDHATMFAACPTDVVCVSTYPPSHETVTVDALKLPLRGILVEKPLGHTAESGRRILEAIQGRGLPMVVPHGMLALRAPVEIIERVRRGEIGALKLVEVQCTRWDIINAGIHWLHFFVTLTNGDPANYVMALCDTTTRTWRDGMQVETVAVTYAETKGGVRVVMQTGDSVNVTREGKDFLFRLLGTEGWIEFWAWEGSYLIQNREHPSPARITPKQFPYTGHRRYLESLADMIHGDPVDYTLPESSLAALEMCEAAYLSHRHRCKVDLPLSSFTPLKPTDWDPGEPYSGVGGGRDGRKLG